jgi:hypothetical protein
VFHGFSLILVGHDLIEGGYKMRLTLLIAALLLVALAFPALAQTPDVSAFSLDRLSIATGLDYAWYTPSSAVEPLPILQRKEWEVPLNLSYNLLSTAAQKPLLSIIAGSSWGFDSHIVKTRVGVRIILFTGGK